jgi:hypothetical protein
MIFKIISISLLILLLFTDLKNIINKFKKFFENKIN